MNTTMSWMRKTFVIYLEGSISKWVCYQTDQAHTKHQIIVVVTELESYQPQWFHRAYNNTTQFTSFKLRAHSLGEIDLKNTDIHSTALFTRTITLTTRNVKKKRPHHNPTTKLAFFTAYS